MKVKNNSFSGGYTFNLEGKPQDKVVEMEIPSKVVIPLKQGLSQEVEAIVEPGEEVKAGQIIAEDDSSISTPVHASVNGTVKEIIELSSKGNIKAVIIESDGTYGWEAMEGHTSDWTSLSASEVSELLYTSGVTALDNQGIPTEYNSSPIAKGDLDHVIIKGVEANPYNLSLSALLKEGKLSQFADGLRILRKILPSKTKVHVAINKNRRKLIKELNNLVGSYNWVEVYDIDPKYPQGIDKVLVPTILGEDYTVRSSVEKLGVTVLRMQTILNVYDAVVKGKALIERIISLSGPGWKENIHLQVRAGTPVEAIVNKYAKPGDYRIVYGNLLTDKSITDYEIPVDKTFENLNAISEEESRELFAFAKAGARKYSYSNAFLSALFTKLSKACNAKVNGEARPCISCGYCEEACPAGIIPHLIDHYTAKRSVEDELIKYGIFDCMECNLCTFVCPSKRALGKHIKQGKQFLMNKGYAVK
jgi:Na(+)-translocating NADH:ubiquinone oxidoreductase A subunit